MLASGGPESDMALGTPRPLSDFLRARLGHWTPWLMMFAFWIIVYVPSLYRGARFSLDPNVMCDDVRVVVFHFFHWMDPALFANDELGQYHADGTPDFYRGLFFLVAKLYDPYAFTKLPPLLLYALTLLGVAKAAKRLGGRAAVFVAVTLCLSSSLFLSRMSGMLPRAFAYPILAWMAAALVAGHVRSLAILTILGAGFYPVLTLLGGGSLASLLFLLPRRDRGSAARWSTSRRLKWLLGTALCSALVTAPFVMRMRPYGAAITPAMLVEFPEAGSGGRQDAQTRPPFAPLSVAVRDAAVLALSGNGTALVPPIGDRVLSNPKLKDNLLTAVLLIAAMGWGLLWLARYSAARRLLALAVAIAISYWVAIATTPRLVVPPRYTLYGVPILLVIVISAAPLGFTSSRWWKRSKWRPWPTHWGILVAGGLLLGLLGTRTRGDVRVVRFAQPSDQPLYAAVAALPKSAMIAGWPVGALETMPIVTRRTALLTRQLHVPYHVGMTLKMRHRMQRLIAAYYASEVEPLRQLRDEFGVTHLVVEHERLEAPGQYFRPFGPAIQEAFSHGQAAGFVVNRLRDSAMVFDGKKHFVLDLSKLPNR